MARTSKLLLGVIAGIISHKATCEIFNRMQAGGTGRMWVRTSRYIVGVLTTAPIFTMLQKEKDNSNGLLSFLLSFMAVGVGVAVGYWLD